MKLRLLIIFALTGQLLFAQQQYRTEILDNNIKSLQIKRNGNAFALPVIPLQGNDVLEISFDEMSHESRSYSYEILHCNADNSISSLNETEYIDGFARGYIDDYALSINTTFLYTNYLFSLPNNDVRFKVSGNYLVNIFEDNNRDKVVARVLFSVTEPGVEIAASVRGNTDIELNRSKQQLDFEVLLRNYQISDPQQELKVLVKQNNRSDNQVFDIKPSYYAGDKLSYNNNRNLIFEGGNEYGRFDFSSIYNYDERIEQIRFERPHHHVYLAEKRLRPHAPYTHDFDANGNFVINHQTSYESADLEADYMFVHLFVPVDKAFTEGDLYVGGWWNYNQLDATSKMDYDPAEGIYYKTMLLKQGGYNYQLWLLPHLQKQAVTSPTEGSHWQTQNQYSIYVYHRPWGGRYDKLIGFKVLE